jgi:FixJ family two-component response regulator
MTVQAAGHEVQALLDVATDAVIIIDAPRTAGSASARARVMRKMRTSLIAQLVRMALNARMRTTAY